MAQSPIKCDLCGSIEDVNYYCVNCCETLCGRCRTAHANGRKTKNDTIVSLQEAHQERFTKSAVILCDTHSSEEVTLFCEKCSEVICAECLTGNHRGHRVTTVKEFKASKLAELNKIIQFLNDKNILHKNVFDKETQNHQQYLVALAQCKEDIVLQKAKVVDEFTKEVEKICDRHFDKIISLQQTEEHRYSEVCKRIQTTKQTVTSMKQFLEDAMEASNPAVMINASREVTQALYGLKDPKPVQLTYPNFKSLDNKYHNISIGILNSKAATTYLNVGGFGVVSTASGNLHFGTSLPHAQFRTTFSNQMFPFGQVNSKNWQS